VPTGLAATDRATDVGADLASAANDVGELAFGIPTRGLADLDMWADALCYVNEHRGSGLYLGIIATPGWRGLWHSPRLTAYVVRSGESEYHGYVADPADVNVQGQRVPTWIAA
jgi:hypothetical protein